MRETADFDVTDFQREPPVDNLMRMFSTEVVEDAEASLKEGRYIAKEVDFVTVMVPGSMNTVRVQMDDFAMKAHGRAYKRWLELGKAKDHIVGTPLAQVTWLSKGLAKELEFFKIFTLEGLAEVSDANCQRMAGLSQLKAKAIAFIKASTEAAPILKMQSQIDELTANLAASQKTIDELIDRLDKKKKAG